MKRLFFVLLISTIAIESFSQNQFVISKKILQDKIKGGWAGQTIGVTFGGPIEFRYCGTMVGDIQPIEWNDGYLKKNMTENAGLYDDLYMDLTFVDVFEKYGLNAPLDSFANAYAHAGYMLWHANLAGRYNILQGIKAPQSGNWINNPHADDIDYEIESDFAGLMSPAMPNAASDISDKIGHIMNYGDGWYGGIYIGAMYSLAFTSNDINYIIREALKAVPKQSEFYQCVNDVIGWHKKYPNDWKQTWFEIQRKWSDEIGCPDGVFQPFNIDAKVNSAYVTLGLLYGKGDFTKTMEITARCGQDADCNPSSAGGILGTILGYDKIPAYWKQGLKDIEDMDFKYTTMSLNDVYRIGYKHAVENILKHGGKEDNDKLTIPVQPVKIVRYEKSFEGHYPVAKFEVNKTLQHTGDTFEFSFDGIGYVLRGESAKWSDENKKINDVLRVSVTIDGGKEEEVVFPLNYEQRRMDLLLFKYKLSDTKHTVKVKLLNEIEGQRIQASSGFIYRSKPVLFRD
jgi:hypothetical protein